MAQTVYDSLSKTWRLRQSHALDQGAVVTSIGSIQWDVSGRCEKPRMRTAKAVPGHVWHPDVKMDSYRKSEYIDYLVPCRRCPPCLRTRSALWRYRAKIETLESSRTWFCTYTVRPDNRVWFRAKASKANGHERLSEGKLFAAIAKEIGKEFTKYLKRIRKNYGVPIRYILVFESHKDGFPHLHALIHEQGEPLTKRQIQAEWPHGHSQAKLCDIQASTYVTKYLSKSMLARVRASLRYGQRSNTIAKDDLGHSLRDTRPSPRPGRARF